MASMNTRLNIKKLDGNIVQKHGGSKQVGFKQLGPGVETGVMDGSKKVGGQATLREDKHELFSKGERKGILEWVEDHDGDIATEWVFWAEDITMSTYLVNRSSSSSIGFKTPVDMLGFFGWLASIKQRMLEPVKVKYIFLGYGKGILGNKLYRLDEVTSKVVLYRNMAFNENGEYKKTFIGSGVEDINEAAFAVAVVDKIYAHELLTFNNTVACEVIFKWEAGLKDDMDARSDVYVLSNGCKKCSDDSDGYYWEYTPAKGNILGLKIIKDQSGNTLRVSQSRIYNEKLALLTTKAGYVTFTEAWKKEIWLKGLLTESRYELRLVVGIATGAWVKGCSHSEVPAQVKVAAYWCAGISVKKEAPVNFLTDPHSDRLTSRSFTMGQADLKASACKVIKHEKAWIEN
ncbi:hypothetical protein Tco_0255837 [Tanacetum coccineum]